MIEETATVVQVEGETAWLQTQRATACGQCAAKKGCGQSVLTEFFSRKTPYIEVENRYALKIGDQVILGVPEEALVKMSALVYLLPLFWAFAGGVLAEYLYGQELFIVGGSIAGLAFGGLCLYYANRFYLGKTGFHPRVIRKLSAEKGAVSWLP